MPLVWLGEMLSSSVLITSDARDVLFDCFLWQTLHTRTGSLGRRRIKMTSSLLYKICLSHVFRWLGRGVAIVINDLLGMHYISRTVTSATIFSSKPRPIHWGPRPHNLLA